jgi:NADH-quinone oxidoreductase subunit N
MKFTCFMVVVHTARGDRNPAVKDLAGLHRRAPLMAMALMIALFGLAGIPPTVGFTGKLLLFTAAMAKGHLVLILIAMVNVVVSLYYYLQVLRAAYLLEPEAASPDFRETGALKALSLLLVAAMVIIGIYPQPLIELTRQAIGM